MATSKSRYDTSDFVGQPIDKQFNIWLSSCMCEDGESPYCTVCQMIWDARERIELLESILCAQAMDNGITAASFSPGDGSL